MRRGKKKVCRLSSHPSSQSGGLGQACGQFVTCREARGTGRGRKSRGESIRLMFVNLNPKGRRLPTKLVSPARRWARGPKCKRDCQVHGIAMRATKGQAPGSRLQAPRLGLPINLPLGTVETTLLVCNHRGLQLRQLGTVSGIPSRQDCQSVLILPQVRTMSPLYK